MQYGSPAVSPVVDRTLFADGGSGSRGEASSPGGSLGDRSTRDQQEMQLGNPGIHDPAGPLPGTDEGQRSTPVPRANPGLLRGCLVLFVRGRILPVPCGHKVC